MVWYDVGPCKNMLRIFFLAHTRGQVIVLVTGTLLKKK
jgi:hypothetical protein